MENKKGILFLTAWFPTEEAKHFGIFVRHWAEAASKFDDITIVHLYGSDNRIKKLAISEKVEDPSIALEFNLYRIKYKKFIFPLSFISYCAYILKVIELFKKIKKIHKVDLIHAYIFRAAFHACILKKIFKINHILTECYTHIQTGFLTVGERLRLKVIGRCTPLIIAISKPLFNAYKKLGVKSELMIIPCTVDTGIFKLNTPQSKSGDSFNILTMCNLMKRKGVDILLKAVSKIENKKIKLIIAGKGEEEDNLKSLANELGISDRVEFLGFVDEKKKAGIYSSCDLFVLPSHKENFGVVLIEAMSTGCPVVATICGGPEDFVVPDVGLLVNSGNEDQLKDAINTIIENYERYEPVKIRKYVEDNFGYEAIGSQMHKIYKRFIDEE